MAQRLIREGRIGVQGVLEPKPATLVDAATPIEVVGPERRFVSRGGEKLDHALEVFAIDVSGRWAIDLGASTGGFTDCLLQRGAAGVTAVDVGYGQIDYRLRTDRRVTLLERTNARALTPTTVGGTFDVVVADLSFISLELVMGAIQRVAAENADIVLLVKPQFEVGRKRVSRGGVVTDPGLWRSAIDRVVAAGINHGLGARAIAASPLAGAAAGNREFLLHLRAGPQTLTGAAVDEALEEAQTVGERRSAS